MPARPILLTASRDLSTPSTSELFRGSERGVELSFFINHTRPGQGTAEHWHPYPEVFVIHDGEAVFDVDGESLTAGAGQVLVVPAEARHGFRNVGDQVLEMLSIHPVAEMMTTWTEPQ